MSGWPRRRIRSSNARLMRAPDQERSTTVASASRVQSSTIHKTRNRWPSSKTSDTKYKVQSPKSKVQRPTLICAIRHQNGPTRAQNSLARPSTPHGQPFLAVEPASCGSLRTPLWQAGCPNGDIQTDVAHSPVHAAVCVGLRRPDPASDTGKQTCADQLAHTPDVQKDRADPSRPTRLVF